MVSSPISTSFASWWGKHVTPIASKINREVVETPVRQVKSAVIKMGHQNATNFKSVSDYIDARMKGICEDMGQNEDCVGDGVGIKASTDGSVTTYNPATGEEVSVIRPPESAIQVEDKTENPQIVVMEPSQLLGASKKWRKASSDVAYDPIASWNLALTNLPAEIQSDQYISNLWTKLVAARKAAVEAQLSGKMRPVISVAPQENWSAEEAVRIVYDSAGQARDVWEVIMGAYKFSWVGVAGSVLSPEKIGNDPKMVPGLYKEEEEALSAARIYYDALPISIKASKPTSGDYSNSALEANGQ